MSEIESGDSSRCDIHLRDLVPPDSAPIGYGKAPNSERGQVGSESVTGGYGEVAGSKRVIFPWAKVETEDPGKYTMRTTSTSKYITFRRKRIACTCLSTLRYAEANILM